MYTKRNIILCLVMLFCTLTTMAEDRMTVNGVQYATTSSTTATACLTVKALGDVEISEKIKIKGKEYTTTEVGRAYFSKNEYLQSVTIPNTVTKIRKGAFAGCTNLVSVRIPNSNCVVEKEAFKGCVAITFICNDDTQLYPVDYILASMPKDIPYYANPEKCKGSGGSPVIKDKYLPDLDWPVDSIIKNMSANKATNTKTFAFIIGNEDYSLGGASRAEYAANDALIFKQYCQKMLGLPESNIKCFTNRTLGQMRSILRLMKQTAKANEDVADSRLIFYYSGHGVPDDGTKDGFLLPVDVDGRHTEDCISLKSLYEDIGNLPVKKVFVFLDACFSGAAREENVMLNPDAKAVVVVVNEEKPKDNMVVLTAATGNETAYPYKDKKHGMLTYYLLNMLYRSTGNCNIGELGDYVKDKVVRKANINNKKQTPTLSVPSAGQDGANWNNLTLK